MSSNSLSDHFGQQLFFPPFQSLEPPREPANSSGLRDAKASGILGQTKLVKPFTFASTPYEYKVVPLRECPTPERLQLVDTPERAVDYWRLQIPSHPYFDPERECFAVFILNARKRIKAHYLVSVGTADSVHIVPRDVFRLAVMTSAVSILLTHNHPSGDPSPSDPDIRVTRELIRAGQLLKIPVVDHIIIGRPGHTSLNSLGYFYDTSNS
jgi:proteasome lid subunit RPN8/RPN11